MPLLGSLQLALRFQKQQRCRGAFLRLHTRLFMGHALDKGTIARFIWEVSPECGVIFQSSLPDQDEEAKDDSPTTTQVSTMQLLIEFAKPIILSDFVQSLQHHMDSFLVEVESGPVWCSEMPNARQHQQHEGWKLQSIVSCPICDEKVWVAYMFHMCATDQDASHCAAAIHYPEESLQLKVENPSMAPSALPMPIWR